MTLFARSLNALLIVWLAAGAPTSALAQTGPAPVAAKPRPDPYGSPLDTLMSTHLWADVPPARDFVRTSRPDPTRLDYAPLNGQDPTRPKPRDAAGVAALQAELESGGAKNEVRAKGLRGPARAAAPRSHKAGAKTARDASIR